ncbi:MutT/NUDIX hydrolase [Vibrio phage USC-1]|uniref:Nudix hydrolase domain-containing protein n=2 Tax=Aphroditevirus USC1 TaxID=2846605 RepID=A0A514A2R1_9CAUD|nr:MutT/NUDIX hydrolase [Vibrio phage USC-1]QCW23164.1 hypothetical protein [Vibrio phage 5 TSL-2019]QDH47564.1 hypothetical protein [Vibrio phage USC-1]
MLFTVGALIKNAEGKLLIQGHKKIGGLTIPSGKLDENERDVVGLARELKEELGVSKLWIGKRLAKWRQTYESLGVVDQALYEVVLNEEPRNMEPTKHPYQDWMSIEEIKSSGKKLSGYLTKVLELEKQNV